MCSDGPICLEPGSHVTSFLSVHLRANLDPVGEVKINYLKLDSASKNRETAKTHRIFDRQSNSPTGSNLGGTHMSMSG